MLMSRNPPVEGLWTEDQASRSNPDCCTEHHVSTEISDTLTPQNQISRNANNERHQIRERREKQRADNRIIPVSPQSTESVKSSSRSTGRHYKRNPCELFGS